MQNGTWSLNYINDMVTRGILCNTNTDAAIDITLEDAIELIPHTMTLYIVCSVNAGPMLVNSPMLKATLDVFSKTDDFRLAGVQIQYVMGSSFEIMDLVTFKQKFQ